MTVVPTDAATEVDPAGPVNAGPARAVRDRPGWVALGCGVAGVGYRIALVAHDVPPANSDEGSTGLAALHIATGQDFPIFFYGQHYLGAVQAYLAAPFVGVFGTTWWALRIPPLILYALFLLLTYRLTRRLYTPWFATAVVALLALGADRVVKNELIGGGGYPESSATGAALLLLAVHLATGTGRRRMVGFLGWGLLAGLAVWGHWLLLPYLAMAGFLLVAGCRRELLGRPGVAVVAGMLTGAAPLIWHNLRAGPGEDSLSVLAALNAAGGFAPLADRWHGGVLVGLPLSTGLCPPDHCTPGQLWWGPLHLALLVVAGVLAVRGLRRARAGRQGGRLARAAGGLHRAGDRAVALRHGGRLALVVAAALTIWLYVGSAGAAQTPIESARYLHYGLISLPAALWPLWRRVPGAVARWPSWRRVPGAVVLAALVATMVTATVALVADVPRIAAKARAERELVAELDRLGVDRFYSEYWTCDRLAYVTRERVRCAVLDERLRPGLNRYPPHAAAVDAAPRPGYVLPVGEPIDSFFAVQLRMRGITAEMTTVGGYHIYLPVRRVDGG